MDYIKRGNAFSRMNIILAVMRCHNDNYRNLEQDVFEAFTDTMVG